MSTYIQAITLPQWMLHSGWGRIFRACLYLCFCLSIMVLPAKRFFLLLAWMHQFIQLQAILLSCSTGLTDFFLLQHGCKSLWDATKGTSAVQRASSAWRGGRGVLFDQSGFKTWTWLQLGGHSYVKGEVQIPPSRDCSCSCFMNVQCSVVKNFTCCSTA